MFQLQPPACLTPAMKKQIFFVDWWLFIPMLVLLTFSLIIMSSINVSLFKSQLFSAVLVIIIFFIVANLSFERLKSFSLPIYIFSLIVLGIVLLLGIESHGAVRWVSLFGASIQFSEICKPLLVLAMAAFLSQHTNTEGKYMFLVLILILPILLFIYLQPDLGDAIIYLAVTLFVLVMYGYSLRWFLLASLPVLVALPLFWSRLHDYQRERILTFLHPTSASTAASYNSIQALIAVGSGMLWGKGLNGGTQSSLRFLPERHSDFIFATLTEELGFIGGVIIIMTYLVLLYRIYILFKSTDDAYARLFLSGAFALILIHVFLNIGMNIGLVPIVGVTLPFVSFGGSSLIANGILLGLATALAKNTRNKQVLEIS